MSLFCVSANFLQSDVLQPCCPKHCYLISAVSLT